MEDQTPTTKEASQNESSDDRDNEGIGFTFYGLDSLASLDSNDVHDLLSLTDHLRDKKDQAFELLCEVIDCRVVLLGILGILGKTYQDCRRFVPKSVYYNPDVISCDLQEFHRIHSRRTSSVTTQSHQSMTFSKLTKLAINSKARPFESISSWMKENPLPSCSKLLLKNYIAQLQSPFILQPHLDWMTNKNLPNLQELVFSQFDLPSVFLKAKEDLYTILRFVKSFNKLHSLGEHLNQGILLAMEGDSPLLSRISNDICCALIENAVGRRLVEGYCWSNDSGDNGNSTRKRIPELNMRFSLPSSVWPIVLERAQSNKLPLNKIKGAESKITKAMKATGIYYLLREGPILRERHQLTGIGRKKLKTETDSGTNK